MKTTRGFIGVIIILVIALVLAGAGTYFVYNYYKEPALPSTATNGGDVPDISIADTKAIAAGIDAVLEAKLTSRTRDCIAASVQSREGSVLYLEIHEVHNTDCKGDPDTAPRITTLKMDASNGTIFYQADNDTFIKLSTSTAALPTSTTWKSYTSSDLGISFNYPSTWGDAHTELLRKGSSHQLYFTEGLFIARNEPGDTATGTPAATIDGDINQTVTASSDSAPPFDVKTGTVSVNGTTYKTISFRNKGADKSNENVFIPLNAAETDYLTVNNNDGVLDDAILLQILQSITITK